MQLLLGASGGRLIRRRFGRRPREEILTYEDMLALDEQNWRRGVKQTVLGDLQLVRSAVAGRIHHHHCVHEGHRPRC